MKPEALQSLLSGAEGSSFRFFLNDGSEMLAQVVSATHVDEDGTVVLLPHGAKPEESAWQVHLSDIRSISATVDGEL
jgi:hypothetical protein